MDKIFKIVPIIAAVLSLATPKSNSAQVAKNYVEGQVIVTFKASVNLEGARRSAGRHSSEMTKHFKWLSEHQHRVYGVVRSKTKTTAALVAELRQDPSVETVEPDYLRQAFDMRPPSDAFFQQLWGLRNTGQSVSGLAGSAGADVGFLSAWGMARSTTNEVVVAVIDSGMDYTHPDLAGNMWTNPGETAANGVDDDGNGYADDVHGYDFINHVSDPTDSGIHGTHIAGTIAAVGNNAPGIIGVDFQAHIMALKAGNTGTNLLESAIIEAIQYAAMMRQRGVNIVAINASFGSDSYSATERAAIQAAGDVGIVLCAAVGNSSINLDLTPIYPASYRLPNMIAVAASDQNDALASFSNYGAGTVDLAAPGVNILSTIPVSAAGTTSHVQQASTSYAAEALDFSGTTAGITGAIYNCGLGYPTNFPPAVSNNIALIQRGTLFFTDKVANAMTAGARAAILYNNVGGNFGGSLQYSNNWIPSVSVSQADGQALLAALPASGTVVVVPDPTQIYAYESGTSVAAPHVCGAVAFAAMNFPGETATQRVQRIVTTTTPIPALQGKVITGGRLNLARSVDTDANGLPDWWEQTYFNQLTGTAAVGDSDHDGESNLAEWLSGTNPTNATSYLRLIPVGGATTTGVTLQWPSVAGKYYRLLRGTNLASGVNQIVRTNIAATPPLNTETDTTPVASPVRFYRLQLEP